ncbi:hypothetical protein Tco_0692500 [Tanacetum coccineum]
MEDEIYHLTVKGNDLKTYVRRFQELATLCPTMVPDSKKMMEVFIGGLPQSIEGNYQVITNESLTTEELSTTTTTIVTPTPTTATIITNYNRTEDRKPSGPCTAKCNTCNKVGHLTKVLQKPKGSHWKVNLGTSDKLLVMPVERKGIMQISAERPPTTMPREEPTC